MVVSRMVKVFGLMVALSCVIACGSKDNGDDDDGDDDVGNKPGDPTNRKP